MKILFICGSLEPGRDGVGDYTRRLAAELIKQGHQTFIGAINDRHLSLVYGGFQVTDNAKVPALRIPSILPNKVSFLTIKSWIGSIEPDWISLQFVPFSFQINGLPFYLGRNLRFLVSDSKMHIMFHELWVGMERKATIKSLFWGQIQREIIQSIIGNTKPSAIHTQCTLYQSQLIKIGIKSKLLPLFSNIPIANYDSPFKGSANISSNETSIVFVVFGGIHSGTPIDQFSKEAGAYAKESKMQLILRFIGRCGKEQEEWINTWKTEGLIVEDYGEQDPEAVSKILRSSKIGIVSTPVALLEKSGSLFAMLEHRLPVISISKKWEPKGNLSYKVPNGVTLYKKGNFSSCIDFKSFKAINTISDVCFQFVNELNIS